MAVEGGVSSAGLVCVGAMAVTDSVHALPAGLVGRTLARCRLPSIGGSLQCMYNIIRAGCRNDSPGLACRSTPCPPSTAPLDEGRTANFPHPIPFE